MENITYCPISKDKLDETVVRIASFIIITMVIPGILLKSYLLFLIIGIDFGLRAFTRGRFSFVKILSRAISKSLHFPVKQIDAAPKKFSAALGMILTLSIAVTIFSENLFISYILSFVLVSCAVLEAFFAVCIGCHIYTWLTTYSKIFVQLNK